MNIFPQQRLSELNESSAPLGEADQAMLREARDVIERAAEIERNAREEGYNQGMNEARRESLGMLMNVVKGNIDSIAQLEQSVVDVCLEAYRSFFGLLGHERMLAGLIHKAISQLPAQQTILVRTSPDQLEAVQQSLDDMTLPTASAVSLLPDQAVKDGECIVQTDTTTTNLSIEMQTEVLFELLRKHFE